MCGIVACRTTRQVQPILLDGLRQLEYRGYDSAGIALSSAGRRLSVRKAAGPLDALEAELQRNPVGEVDRSGVAAAIGHTRWATHGAPTAENAHPHLDCHGRVAVVHNGVIENHRELREQLYDRGHDLQTCVDSELIAHLIEDELADGAPAVNAVYRATEQLKGSWALAVLFTGSDDLVLARNRSPLLIARSEHGFVAASDLAALPVEASDVWRIDEGEHVLVNSGFDPVHLGKPLGRRVVTIPEARRSPDSEQTIVEIAEQAGIAERLLRDLGPRIASGGLARELTQGNWQRVKFIGCGSSRYAAEVIAGVLRGVGGFPAIVDTASEPTFDRDDLTTLTVALSQSGETADILRLCEGRRTPLLAITNAEHSSLATMADGVLPIRAGQEFGVAATKSFTAQVIAGTCWALSVLSERGLVSSDVLRELVEAMLRTPQRMADTDAIALPAAAAIAEDLHSATGVVFTGRGLGVPYAAEGALKLKELTYQWTEALPAGELKHGPIAIIEPGTPVVAIDDADTRLESNLEELRSRGGVVLKVGSASDATLPSGGPQEQLPWGPLESVVALQHLARAVAVRRGNNVDRPRNLAKSVTVE